MPGEREARLTRLAFRHALGVPLAPMAFSGSLSKFVLWANLLPTQFAAGPRLRRRVALPRPAPTLLRLGRIGRARIERRRRELRDFHPRLGGELVPEQWRDR